MEFTTSLRELPLEALKLYFLILVPLGLLSLWNSV